jgi:REP element-mobilizing transposase RayT
MTPKSVPFIPGQYYHIYNRAIAGNLLFREEQNYPFFLSRIEKYILPAAELIAFCLMPNHYHFILKLKTNNISTPMKRMALSYVKSFNLVYDQSGHLFQGPFQRIHITDLNYLVHLSRYIHLNPVKANLVPIPKEWVYSSYQDYVGIRDPEMVNIFPILDLISEDPNSSPTMKHQNYRNFVDIWNFEYMEFKLKT